MRKIVDHNSSKDRPLELEAVGEEAVVIACNKGTDIIAGMVFHKESGYVTLRPYGANYGSSGYHSTLIRCIRHDMQYYDFYVQ